MVFALSRSNFVSLGEFSKLPFQQPERNDRQGKIGDSLDDGLPAKKNIVYEIVLAVR